LPIENLDIQKANFKAALSLAQAGIPIFPAHVTYNPNEERWHKAPLIAGWQHLATTDHAQIEDWWALYPDAVPGG
jgi:Bifunctional DNA primase/polymerase, N-terminal